MSSEHASRWDAPSASSSSAPTGQPDQAASAAAAVAAQITASIRGPSGALGNELIKIMPGEEGFTKDIPINDLKNRYVLTKGSTQKQVSLVLRLDSPLNFRFPKRLEHPSLPKVFGSQMLLDSDQEKSHFTSTSLQRHKRLVMLLLKEFRN